MVSARFDGSTDCSGMEEMSHTMTTWKRYWRKRRLNRFYPSMLLQNTLVTSLSFGLECLRWEFSSPQCSMGGGRTSIVALLDLRNLSGCSAALVATLTPSTRNAIDQGRHTQSTPYWKDSIKLLKFDSLLKWRFYWNISITLLKFISIILLVYFNKDLIEIHIYFNKLAYSLHMWC